MNTEDDRHTEAQSTTDARTRHEKRPWVHPLLLIESQRHTATKVGLAENAVQGPSS